jgi:hypothetical protein
MEWIVLMVWKDEKRRPVWEIVRVPPAPRGSPHDGDWRAAWAEFPRERRGDFPIRAYVRPVSPDERIFPWQRRLVLEDLNGTAMCPLSLEGYKVLLTGDSPPKQLPETIYAEYLGRGKHRDTWMDVLGRYEFKVVPPHGGRHCRTCTCTF